MDNPLNTQIEGSHYKDLKIQFIEYVYANNIPFIEASCIKYLTRWRQKGGIADLEKVKHYVDLLTHLSQTYDKKEEDVLPF